MGEAVTTQIDAGMAQIRMDDGKVNAMSPDLMTQIGAALDVAEDAKAVAVLRGREGIFSAGFDLRVFQQGPEESRRMVRMGAELILRFLQFPYPIMTVAQGHAYPMGAFLMLSSDARFAAEGPWKFGLNETAIGLTVPKFAVELARHRLAPPAFARISAGTLMNTEQALRAGYVDVVVPLEALDDAVNAEAQRLRALDIPSFQGTKQHVNAPVIRAVSEALAAEWGES